MKGFLSTGGPIIRALGTLGDIALISFYTLILCIPVITAGAAFTAMHYVFLKMIRGEEGHISAQYFRSFKDNFRQSTILWLILLALGILVAANFYAMHLVKDSIPMVMQVIVIVIALLLYMAALYVFPVQAHFENTVKGTLKNAALIAAASAPRSFLSAVITLAVPAILFAIYRLEGGEMILFRLFPLALLPGIFTPSYFHAWNNSAVFRRFEPNEEDETGEDTAR